MKGSAFSQRSALQSIAGEYQSWTSLHISSYFMRCTAWAGEFNPKATELRPKGHRHQNISSTKIEVLFYGVSRRLTHPQSPLGRRHPYPEFQPLLAQNGWNSQIWKVRSRSEFGANTYNYTTHALPGDSFGASPTRQPVRKPCTNGSCSHIRILASRSTSAGDAVMPETLIGVECVFCSCLSDVL